MLTVDLFTPVYFELGKDDFALKVVEYGEWYLSFATHKVCVIDGNQVTVLEADEESLLALALRVASFATLILPALALLAKIWVRMNHEFELLEPSTLDDDPVEEVLPKNDPFCIFNLHGRALAELPSQDYHFQAEQVNLQEIESYKDKRCHDAILEVLESFLDQYGGIGFGESHKQFEPKLFIQSHLMYLKEMGGKYLFMEEFHVEQQDDIDRFMMGKQSSDEFVEGLLEGKGRKCAFHEEVSYREILETARALKIRVIAIDSRKAVFWGEPDAKKRNRSLSYLAMKVMQAYLMPGDRYIAFMGSGHLKDQYKGIPGVCDLMKIPSVVLDVGEKDHYEIFTDEPYKVIHPDMIIRCPEFTV